MKTASRIGRRDRRPHIRGYMTDIPYTFGFKPMLAPAWIDFVAVLAGRRPPHRGSGFAWCDLGCGQGVTAAILAATHPAGEFHAIDAMAAHVRHAAALASEAEAANARFHCTDIAAALDLPMPRFDYIVAHGVYTWVDAATRLALRRFIDRRLKSGGLVYVSYNALPGWTGEQPFQHLLRTLADAANGDSNARLAAASDFIDRLAVAGASSLAASQTVRELRRGPDDYRPGYLVHEFLPAGWQPLYVTELRRDFAEIGLEPVGSALLMENFDGWMLGRRGRALLAEIADPDRRELVRDFLLDQRFRCDVFARDAPRIDAGEQRRLLSAAGLALMRPAGAVGYAAVTPAGRLDFANPAARAVVAALSAGARCLADIAAGDASQGDLLANALALCAAGDIRPVETGRVPVAALNRALVRRLGTPHEIEVIALPCGTALDLDEQLFGLLTGEMDQGWREFLAMHGA